METVENSALQSQIRWKLSGNLRQKFPGFPTKESSGNPCMETVETSSLQSQIKWKLSGNLRQKFPGFPTKESSGNPCMETVETSALQSQIRWKLSGNLRQKKFPGGRKLLPFLTESEETWKLPHCKAK
jgi:hypothetical protein